MFAKRLKHPSSPTLLAVFPGTTKAEMFPAPDYRDHGACAAWQAEYSRRAFEERHQRLRQSIHGAQKALVHRQMWHFPEHILNGAAKVLLTFVWINR